MAASWLLPEAVGLSRAREMLYTGRAVRADEALEWGLVNGVADDVLARAIEVAAGIAAAAPIAVRLTKAGLAQAAGGGFEAALQWEALAQPVTMSTADIHEGIRARRERRSPTFERPLASRATGARRLTRSGRPLPRRSRRRPGAAGRPET